MTLLLAAHLLVTEATTWVRARHLILIAALTGRTAATATASWAQSPANWCDRPGCPRCLYGEKTST